MSRLLLHGPHKNQGKLAINLDDGGSVMINQLLQHSALKLQNVTYDEVMSISMEKGGDRKLRFEVEATASGAEIRRLQGHTTHKMGTC